MYTVFFFTGPPKKQLSARPLGNSDTENFFDAIYYLIWHPVEFKVVLINTHCGEWKRSRAVIYPHDAFQTNLAQEK